MKKNYTLLKLFFIMILGLSFLQGTAQKASRITTNATVLEGAIENLSDGQVATSVKLNSATEDVWVQFDFEQQELFNNYGLGIKNFRQFAPDWGIIADEGHNTLHELFWNTADEYYNQEIRADGSIHTGFNYWWNAHALDIIIDAYERTGSQKYKDRLDFLYYGCYAKNGNRWWNTFYDDMEWMGLAHLRAYQATGEEKFKTTAVYLWEEIKKGWTDVKGGGIMWASGSPNSKNACSNAPAMILGARIYQLDKNPEDLEFLIKLYDWMYENLVDKDRGVVWDGYGNFNESNVYTYNIGTWIGGCLELWKITKEQKYLDNAIKSTTYTVTDPNRLSVNGVLLNSGRGDGGLFGCIFMRYLSQMIQYADLDAATRQVYVDYFERNALSLWSGGTYKFDGKAVFGKNWITPPVSVPEITSSNQMSGVMLLELMAELERKSYYDNEGHQGINIKLQGSDDDSQWFDIDEKNNECFLDDITLAKYSNEPKAAKFMRILFPGSAGTDISISEINFVLQLDLSHWDATDNGGLLTASHPGESGYEVANVIDNAATKYVVKNFDGEVWIEYVSPVPLSLSGYFLLAGDGDLGNSPKSWEVSASTGNGDWKVLDTQSDRQFAGALKSVMVETKTWDYNNNKHTHFRLKIKELNGGEDLELADWQIIAPVVEFDSNPDYDFTNNGGILTAQHEGYPNETFINATDNLLGKKYCVVGSKKGWLQYESSKSMVMTGYAITAGVSNRDRDLTEWEILGSKDGEDWIVLDKRTDQKFWMRYNTIEYKCAETTEGYTFFRLNILNNNGAGDFQFAEFQMFGYEDPLVSVGNGTVDNGLSVKTIGDAVVMKQTGTDAVNYGIYDVSGRLITKGIFEGVEHSIRLNNGMYIIRLSSNEDIYTTKVIVQ